MQDISIVDSLVASGRIAEAIEALTDAIAGAVDGRGEDASLAELYFRRGKLYWRVGRRSEATSDYAKAAAIVPDGAAAKALEQARDVAAFFNPDLYNP